MKIFLLRHGEYENPNNLMPGRSAGFPLSKEGMRQAHEAAVFLKDKAIGTIISSPILRTKQTAEIVAQEIGIAMIEYDDRLIEMEVGEYANQPLELFRNSGFYQDMVNSPPGIENIDSVCLRTKDFLEKVSDRDQNALVVTHVYSIRCFLCLITGAETKFCYQFKPETGQVWEIDSDSRGERHIRAIFPPSKP